MAEFDELTHRNKEKQQRLTKIRKLKEEKNKEIEQNEAKI